ncbi:MAG: NADH-quinone oxidoreductase subunit J [Proteobacteria bacterium]|nr:NADH-quinone oxidoreductase subunit J [Pseudomonadota bacterium]
MEVLFYFFSLILIFSALKVITSRNPVLSALFLVLSFFSAGGIWLLLKAEFLAIALVLVYVGAVMVLFLFVVMMLDINIDRLKEGFWDYMPVASIVAVIMLIEMILVLNHSYFKDMTPKDSVGISNTEALGQVLYTDYVFPFEIASIILLVAIVAAILLTLRGMKTHKGINPADQIKVQRNQRIKMVKMKSQDPVRRKKR